MSVDAILTPLIGGVVGGAAQLLSRKKVQTPKAQPLPTRNMAAERAAVNDTLARREGTRANRRTGYGGAEAATGAKTSLLGR
ncbi:MAG: hypothetical protein WBL20_09535 [Sphingobium sp.]|uniref:hypothetical protein n=1 Tax=Sphingobium sp. TaxID=1912891 RepID=UPI003BAFE043